MVRRSRRPRTSSASQHLRDRIDAAPGRPARPALADRRAARTSQPDEVYNLGGDVVRRRVVDPADADRGVHRRRRHAAARGDARGLPRGALLPGLVERDVRQGARDAADRDDAVLPAQPVRRRQGLRALHHGQLPRELRPLRLLGDPLQPRVAAPRPRVRDPQDHPRRRARSSSGSRDELRLGNLDAQRDWGYAGDYVRGDVADAAAGPSRTTTSSPPARRTRSATSSSSPSSTSGSTGSDARRRSTRASCARPRSICCSATPRRPSASSAGSRDVSFEELVAPDGRRRPRAARRLAPALEQVLVGDLADLARRDADDDGARRHVLGDHRPGRRRRPPRRSRRRADARRRRRSGRRGAGSAPRSGSSGPVAAHRVVVGDRHARADEDVVLDHACRR